MSLHTLVEARSAPARALSTVFSISRREHLARLGGERRANASPVDCHKDRRRPVDAWMRPKRKLPRLKVRKGSFYLKAGFTYSKDAVTSYLWRRRKERVSWCGDTKSPHWHAGITKNDRRFNAPRKCHAREHAKCRPSEVRERILNLMPLSFLTLTDRRNNSSKRVRDWRFGSVGKRLDRFFNLLRKLVGHFQYVWVREVHESGFPHIHVVLSIPLPTSEVSYLVEEEPEKPVRYLLGPIGYQSVKRMWLACGGGYSVRWEALQADGCYIAKYCDKADDMGEELNALIAVNKLRDWSASKGIRAPRTDLPWTFYARGTQDEVSYVQDVTIETARAELAARLEVVRDLAIAKEARRQKRLSKTRID